MIKYMSVSMTFCVSASISTLSVYVCRVVQSRGQNQLPSLLATSIPFLSMAMQGNHSFGNFAGCFLLFRTSLVRQIVVSIFVCSEGVMV